MRISIAPESASQETACIVQNVPVPTDRKGAVIYPVVQRTGIGLHGVSTVTALNPAVVAGSVVLVAAWEENVTDGIVREAARTAVVATINAAQLMVSGAAGANMVRAAKPAEVVPSPAPGGVKEELVVELVVKAIAENNENAMRIAALRTANSPHGVSGKGAPRHVEEVHSSARGDVRAKNVEEKDALELLLKDVTATSNAALRMVRSVSGADGASVPRAAAEALSPVIERAKVKLVEERVVIHMNRSIRVVHAERSVVR